MCGLAGIVDLRGERPVDREALERMTRALAHRGPDGEGFFQAPGVGLGHRRLAIIDAAGGAQPYHAASGGGVLAFNGEIYNYAALASDLAARGSTIRTRSDTEALAEGLDAQGAPFIDRLRGMFAFAWWNAKTRTLILARDRLGERPLYYAETPDGFLIFASEISALAASGLAPFEICPYAVSDYFHFGYVPDPKTIYRGVFKLPPGTFLTAGEGRLASRRRYWRPAFAPEAATDFASARRTLLEKLDEAVRLQMISDVPLGAFLSGGVDSSAVVASMAQGGGSVLSCAIGFDEASHDERPHARAVAARFGTEHQEEIARLDLAVDIDRAARAFGEPFADASALPTYAVCRLARRHATVALSGDGGDEIFAGYRRYPFYAAEERLRSLAPGPLRRATFGAAGAIWPKLDWAPRPVRFKTTFQALGETSAEAYLRAAGVNLPERAAEMLSGDLKATLKDYSPTTVIDAALDEDSPRDPLSRAQAIDFATWLPGRMLTKVDRASMAHALEVRPPLLDHELVAWACRLDPAFKLGPGPSGRTTGKRVLKAALETRLPEDILYRPKQGFGLPLGAWLRKPDGPLERLRASDAWRESGLVEPRAVEAMARAHQSGGRDCAQELWSVIMFDAFLREARRLQTRRDL